MQTGCTSTASSARHFLNSETSPHAAQRPAFRGPLRGRRLETAGSAVSWRYFSGQSLTSTFQSPGSQIAWRRPNCFSRQTGSQTTDGGNSGKRCRDRSRKEVFRECGRQLRAKRFPPQTPELFDVHRDDCGRSSGRWRQLAYSPADPSSLVES